MTIIDKINNRFGKPFLYVIGATIVGSLILTMCLDENTLTNNPSLGDNIRLYDKDFDYVLVAVNEKAYDEYVSAVTVKDKYGIEKLLLSGDLFVVDNNTTALMIDSTWTLRKIRILSGKMKGMSGWVPFEVVKSLDVAVLNMIPSAQLVGAVQNVDVTISGRIKKCTEDSNDSYWIKATGIVPFDIKREQVKPTLLAVFKATKAQYPHCEKIFVELAPSQELAETLNLAGRIEYEKGILKLNYSIPSNQQIEEHNSKIGKSEPSVSLKKETFFELDYKNMQINNNLPFPPTKEAFDVGKKIIYAMSDPALMKYKSEQRFKIISKNMGLSEKEAKRYDRLIYNYYSLLGSGRGEEIIRLK